MNFTTLSAYKFNFSNSNFIFYYIIIKNLPICKRLWSATFSYFIKNNNSIIRSELTLETAIIQTFENVISAKFEVENNIKFLRVQTNLRDLKQIEELTRKISNFIDNFSSDNNQFYLDVLSQGTDTKLDFAKLENHINEHIQV